VLRRCTGVTRQLCGPDHDADGFVDVCDNCRATPNADQIDSDRDYAGDACDPFAGAMGEVNLGDRPAGAIAVGDLDGEAGSEIVVGTNDTEVVNIASLVYRKGANVTVLSEAYDHMTALALADMDDDDDLDVVVGTNDGEIAFVYNPYGTPAEWTASTKIDGFGQVSDIAAGDMDGDGDVDLIATSRSLGIVRWWEQLDGDFVPHDVAPSFAGAESLDVGDVDRDDHLDIVAASAGLQAVRLWEDDSGLGTSLEERTIATDVVDVSQVVIADLNGSSYQEIIVGSNDQVGGYGKLAYYEREGSSWVEADLGFPTITGLSAGDFDGDRLDDLLACNGGNAGMLFRNDGAGGFDRVVLDREIGDCDAALIADVDGSAPAELLFSDLGGDRGVEMIRVWKRD
jgi:hypothetical protein